MRINLSAVLHVQHWLALSLLPLSLGCVLGLAGCIAILSCSAAATSGEPFYSITHCQSSKKKNAPAQI